MLLSEERATVRCSQQHPGSNSSAGSWAPLRRTTSYVHGFAQPNSFSFAVVPERHVELIPSDSKILEQPPSSCVRHNSSTQTGISFELHCVLGSWRLQCPYQTNTAEDKALTQRFSAIPTLLLMWDSRIATYFPLREGTGPAWPDNTHCQISPAKSTYSKLWLRVVGLLPTNRPFASAANRRNESSALN